MPPRNKNFTGREDLLERLRAGIAGHSGRDDRVTAVLPQTTAAPQALQGLGGVGKTQLAVEYAYRYSHEYDLVWWVPAEQSALVRSTLAQLAQAAPELNVPDPATRGIEEAAEGVLNALRSGSPYDRWLLIFDNADEPEDLNDIVPRGPGHVLITSRNHRWESVVDTLPLDVFSREESVAFLRKRVKRGLTAQDAERLADALGDLPLALEQAGALQAETGMSTDEYLQLLKAHANRLLQEGKPSGYPLSMSAAWALSVENLQQRRPEAVELLRCCAFFGPEPIPRDVFSQTDDPAVRPELSELLADPIRLSTAINGLGRYALVRIEKETRTLQVHRLIQALLREELDDTTRGQIRSEVHALLAAYAPESSTDPAGWSRYAAVLPHVLPAGVPRSREPRVRAFAQATLEYLVQSGDYRSTGRYAETMIRRWEEDAAGEPDLDILRARRVQANMLRETGHYEEAYDLDVRTLDRLVEMAGTEHEEVLVVRNGLGADLRARGDFRGAREHDVQTVELHQRVLGDSSLRTLRSINSLALDYGLTSEYPLARQLHEQAFVGLQKLGQDAPRTTTLIFWNGLARAVRLCGDYVSACDLGDEAYAFGVAQLGAEHPWTLRTGKDLAIARLRNGELDDALEMAEEVHARCVRLFGLDNPDTLAATINLSNVRRTRGDTREALTLVDDTMHRYPRMYGREHPYYHGCAGNVALLHRVLGDPERSREMNEQALTGLRNRLTADHHYSLTVAVNLASDLAALGDLEAAVERGRDTLTRLRSVLGDDHPTTLASAANLSVDLTALDRKDEAQGLHADTSDRYARVLTLEHRDAEVFLEGRHLDCDFDPPPI